MWQIELPTKMDLNTYLATLINYTCLSIIAILICIFKVGIWPVDLNIVRYIHWICVPWNVWAEFMEWEHLLKVIQIYIWSHAYDAY